MENGDAVTGGKLNSGSRSHIQIITYRTVDGHTEQVTIPPDVQTIEEPPESGEYIRAAVTGIAPARTQAVQLIDGINGNIINPDITGNYHENGVEALKRAFEKGSELGVPVLIHQVDIR